MHATKPNTKNEVKHRSACLLNSCFLCAMQVYSFRHIQDVLHSSFVVTMPGEWVTGVQQLFRDTPGIPQAAHSSTVFSPVYRNVGTGTGTGTGGTGMNPSTVPRPPTRETHMNQLRLLLNKLTPKTYATIRDQCNEQLQLLLTDESVQQSVAQLMFSLASANRMYAVTFASLCGEWMTQHAWFREFIDTQLAQWTQHYHASVLVYVDADDDYDAFCENNKANEKRRALTAFYQQLVIQQHVPMSVAQDMLMTLLQWMTDHVQQDEFRHCLDDWVEHVAILHAIPRIMNPPTPAQDLLRHLQTLDVDDLNLGLSSKTRFKLKELVM